MQNDKLELLHKQCEIKKAVRKMNGYEQLFSSMGIIDIDKGNWIELESKNDNPCYKILKFRISDNLSVNHFQTNREFIAQKIPIDERYFRIFEEDGRMCFMIKKEEMPTVEYKYSKCGINEIPLAVNLDNEIKYWDLTKDSHMLATGATNSGKSTMLNMILLHIIESNKGILHLIDLKNGVEFYPFRKCRQVKTFALDLESSKDVITKFIEEADRRFEMLLAGEYRNYEAMIADKPELNLKREFLVIDEFADLMELQPKTKKEKKAGEFDVLAEVTKLARKSRAVGLHIIISTQRPTADNLPTTLRAQLLCKVGFRQSSADNSRIAIGENGLEKLPNRQCAIETVGNLEWDFRTMYLSDEHRDKILKRYSVNTENKMKINKTERISNEE